MRKLLFLLNILLPDIVIAQSPFPENSPLRLHWQYVGDENFSSGQTSNLSFAFSPADSLPYVAFASEHFSWKASVMKFDGSGWVYVGPGGFSTASAF